MYRSKAPGPGRIAGAHRCGGPERFAQDADTSGKNVALSNNYAGNSWRQAMLRAGRT